MLADERARVFREAGYKHGGAVEGSTYRTTSMSREPTNSGRSG